MSISLQFFLSKCKKRKRKLETSIRFPASLEKPPHVATVSWCKAAAAGWRTGHLPSTWSFTQALIWVCDHCTYPQRSHLFSSESQQSPHWAAIFRWIRNKIITQGLWTVGVRQTWRGQDAAIREQTQGQMRTSRFLITLPRAASPPSFQPLLPLALLDFHSQFLLLPNLVCVLVSSSCSDKLLPLVI